ncbi:MAG: ribose-phosphate pyrophosphokinase [Chloroflexaceae bacterium]|nr:ribose-phosphate pyrophosphokinase [Chloroflexaceae bacterium]
MDGRLQVFSGNANRPLAEQIVSFLNINLSRATVGTLDNTETRVKLDDNVRGCDVFVVQSTSAPINHHLMELLLIIDALRRASAARVTAVIPFYGYARQEKKSTGREPISAKLVANLIRTAGADRVLTMDLHAPAIEGFFDIPVDHLQAAPLLAGYINKLHLRDLVIVSPDTGGVGRANSFRDRIGADLAIIARRHTENKSEEIVDVVGDIEGKHAIIVDDMISTGRTAINAARALYERGAKSVYACATHGVFSANALSVLPEAGLVETVVTDTILASGDYAHAGVQMISVAPLFAEAITRIHKNLSLSALFS